MAIFKFNKESPEQASYMTPQDFSDAGFWESVLQDILVKNLDKLSPADDLMVLSKEYSFWDDSKRRIDILAIDKAKNLVVVELKRTNDASHAELQALRYAAMLSTHTIEDAINALHAHRIKDDPNHAKEQAKTDLLGFLDCTTQEETRLSGTPRIMLISQNFSSELTTTVMWLMGNSGIQISCHTATLYQLADGHAVHFDLLLPLPQQAEYLVKVRKKNMEEAKQSEAMQRRQRTWVILENKGLLKKDETKICLHAPPYLQMNIPEDAQRQATYVGAGRVRWAYDGQDYASLNSLTKALCNVHGITAGSIQGPAYWRRTGSSVSLADEATVSDKE